MVPLLLLPLLVPAIPSTAQGLGCRQARHPPRLAASSAPRARRPSWPSPAPPPPTAASPAWHRRTPSWRAAAWGWWRWHSCATMRAWRWPAPSTCAPMPPMPRLPPAAPGRGEPGAGLGRAGLGRAGLDGSLLVSQAHPVLGWSGQGRAGWLPAVCPRCCRPLLLLSPPPPPAAAWAPWPTGPSATPSASGRSRSAACCAPVG